MHCFVCRRETWAGARKTTYTHPGGHTAEAANNLINGSARQRISKSLAQIWANSFPVSSEVSPIPCVKPLPHSTSIPQRMFQDLAAISIHVTKPLQKSAVTGSSSDHNQVCLFKLKMAILGRGRNKYTSRAAVTKTNLVSNVGKCGFQVFSLLQSIHPKGLPCLHLPANIPGAS